MGKLLNGILGTMTGKVSGVVGSKWKGVNTVRGYAKPSNPNTAAQIVQRGLFSFVIGQGKLILTSILQVFWNPFASGQSGFNLFNSVNLKRVSSDSDYASLLMAQGSLEGGEIDTFTYNSGTGLASITYPDTHIGNGEDTDDVNVVILDAENGVAFSSIGNATRVDGADSFNIGAGRTPAQLHGYMFFSRGAGSTLEVSTSDYSVISAS